MKTFEKLALEVARELSEEGFSGTGTDYTLAFYPRFLAAVDAERGKSAAAYAVRNDFEGSHFEYIAMWPEACHEHINDYYERVFADGDQPEKCTVVPLFLSPTIPPGFALVPLEPTQEMCEQAYYEFNAEQNDFDAANLYRAMIQAAGVTK